MKTRGDLHGGDQTPLGDFCWIRGFCWDFVGISFLFGFFAGAVTYKFAFAAIRGFALLSICSTLAVLAQGISRGRLDVRKRDYRERQVRGAIPYLGRKGQHMAGIRFMTRQAKRNVQPQILCRGTISSPASIPCTSHHVFCRCASAPIRTTYTMDDVHHCSAPHPTPLCDIIRPVLPLPA